MALSKCVDKSVKSKKITFKHQKWQEYIYKLKQSSLYDILLHRDSLA